MIKYFASPMKLFGKFGLWMGGMGICSLFAAGAMKLLGGVDLTGNPFLLLGILSTILSVQFFSLGLIGEVCARIYYSSGRRTNYQVREFVNFHPRQVVPFRKVA